MSAISIFFFSSERHAIIIYPNTTGISNDTMDIAFNVNSLDEEFTIVRELCKLGVAG